MLALLVDQRLPRVLVVVPTSNLREQIAQKFITLGILKEHGVVSQNAPFPIVGKIEHRFASEEDADRFFRSCNVVVATMQAINTCSEAVRRKIADLCSHLIIDEAHHVSAPSWDRFRQQFHGKPILQFTATPFRNDGKHVGGKIIFCYPLRKAQEENYFKKINFRPVFTFNEHDGAIAKAAVEQLEVDLEAGLDHIIMARVDSIERASEVLAVYASIAPKFGPVVAHSEITAALRNDALAQLRKRESRVIVCVNMLGEGFDLPELKIAALHDVHKSLAITLQFIGRFTRVKGDKVGEATVVANRADINVQQQLRALYAEDADWNQVIRDLSQGATGEQEQKSEFNQAFGSLPREVPIQNVAPKMSTVAYRTQCARWEPTNIRHLFSEDELYTKNIAISEVKRVAWFVTEERTPISWGEVRELENIAYNLYVLYWDEKRKLLFINSSNNASLHEDIAQAVAEDSVEIVRGENVYRAMHGIQRMVPTNLGLSDLVSRTRRFMMLVGADVVEGLEQSQTQTKTKTNLFGFGFEGGERASIGCSLKGRIWSYLIAEDISGWVDWCNHIGVKLVDESISTDDVFRGFIKPQYVQRRPSLMPLAIEWPLAFLAEQENKISVVIGDETVPFYETTLEITEHKREGLIPFRVTTEHGTALYEAVFGDKGTRYVCHGNEAIIAVGKRSKPLSDWLHQFAPKFFFENDTFIEHDLLLHVERQIAPFDVQRIEAWDWSGINLKKESQGLQKAPDSIQRKVIDYLIQPEHNWDVVFDDDDAREVADVVAIRMTQDRLIVHLYHCKFSMEEVAGQRVDDMYAVCGQA